MVRSVCSKLVRFISAIIIATVAIVRLVRIVLSIGVVGFGKRVLSLISSNRRL